MDHGHAVLGQALRNIGKEGLEVRHAHVLKETDRYNAVISAFDIAIIARHKLRSTGEAAVGSTPVRRSHLLRSYVDTGDTDIERLRQEERQSAPAAADVEHT